MDENLARRVRAAAGAGWCTILILAAYMVVAWLIWLPLVRLRPGWLLTLWGGGTSWATVHSMYLWAFAVMKLLLLAAAMVALWLTLWARRLSAGEKH